MDTTPAESIDQPLAPVAARTSTNARRLPAILRPTTTEDRLQLAALIVLGLSLVFGAIRALQSGWIPVGDEALIEMRVRDVPSHMPLLGVYSRFGWSHPGPAQFVLLAIPYRLLGSVSAALLVGAMVGHLIASVVAWLVARRIDRVAGVLVLVAMELVLLCAPADLVRSAWNPYVAFLMAGLMVVVGWGVASRVPLATALLFPLGTLLIQSHVGNLPLVALVVATSLPLAWWWHGQRPLVAEDSSDPADAFDPAIPWRRLVIGAVIAALMWLPAIIEQFSGDGGNLSSMVRDLSGDEPRLGASASIGLASQFFGLWPAWTNQQSLVQQIAGTDLVAPVWLLVPLAAVVVAWRRHDRTMLRGLIIGAAAVVSTVVAAASVKGVMFTYLAVGHRSIVSVVMAISLATLARALPANIRRVVMLSLSGLAVVLAIGVGVLQASAHNPSVPFDATVRAATTAVEDAAEGRPVFITSTVDDPSRDVASGLLLQLERAGVDASTVRDEDWRMGARRTSDGVGALPVFVAPVEAEQQLIDDGWRIVLEYQPLSADESDRVASLSAERDALIAEGEAVGPDDPGAAARFTRIQELAAQIEKIRDGRLSTLVAVRD